VNDKLKKLRIAPSGQCDDEAFLRRAAIDIVGLPPTLDEFNRFMASTDPASNVSQKAMFLYYNWLVDKLSKNMPMDQMVQELLGASGGTFKNAATNFYQITNETLPL